jgi:hypothetical protein
MGWEMGSGQTYPWGAILLDNGKAAIYDDIL